MIDLNRIVSYVTISLILLFGIAAVSGLMWDFTWKWRLAIGIIVGLYVVIRVWMMSLRSKPRSMIKSSERIENE